MKSFNIEDMIIYEDKDILVCKKPSGIAVQSRNTRALDMESALRNYLVKKGEVPYIAVIHRLDQPVQGILVFGKNKESGAELSRQIQQGKMEKFYLTCVDGVPAEKEKRLIDELEKDVKNNVSKVVKKKTGNSKNAVLDYKTLKEENGRALLEVHLQTGRHHQIRVQLSHAGLPIVGDTKYNPGKDTTEEWRQIALCAYKLSFIHPKTKKKMEFQVMPDGNFPIV